MIGCNKYTKKNQHNTWMKYIPPFYNNNIIPTPLPKKSYLKKIKKKTQKNKKNKKGGNNTLNLAYTGSKINTISNPFIGYTHKGGCSAGCGGNKWFGGSAGFPKPSATDNISLSKSQSIYPGSAPYLVTGGSNNAPIDLSKAYPSTIGTPAIQNWLNSQTKKGGSSCGCQSIGSMFSMKGGRNYGDLVPNGLLGSPWSGSIKDWPGVDGVSMNRNHFPLNTYANDISRQMLNIGANFPFNIKGGGRRKYSKKNKKIYKQKGRGLDLINLGRTLNYNIQDKQNEALGIPPPINPLPWKDQFVQR